jgi:hypothetical protein
MGLNTRPPGRREAPPAPFSVAGGRLWAGRQGQRPNSQTSKQTCGTQSGMRRNYCALRYLSPGLRHFHVRAPQHAEHSQKAPTQIEQLPKYGGQCDTLHDVHGQVGPGKQVLFHVASLRFPPPSFLRGRSDARVTILVQLYTKVTFPGLMHSAQRVEYDINNDLIS